MSAIVWAAAAVWSVVLAWKIAGLATANYLRRFVATLCVALALDRRGELGCVFLGLAVT